MRTTVGAALSGLVFSTVVLLFTFTVFSIGPAVETRLFPVFSDVRATAIDVDDKQSILRLASTATKQRQCEWQEIVALVERDNVWYQGRVYFTDPRLDNPSTVIPATRPPGLQILGEIFVFPHGEKVRVYTYHQCHPFWQTFTPMYELDFKKSPVQVEMH